MKKISAKSSALKVLLLTCFLGLTAIVEVSATETHGGNAKNIDRQETHISFRCRGSNYTCFILDATGCLCLFDHGVPNNQGCGWSTVVPNGTGIDDGEPYTDFEGDKNEAFIGNANLGNIAYIGSAGTMETLEPSTDWEFNTFN